MNENTVVKQKAGFLFKRATTKYVFSIRILISLEALTMSVLRFFLLTDSLILESLSVFLTDFLMKEGRRNSTERCMVVSRGPYFDLTGDYLGQEII